MVERKKLYINLCVRVTNLLNKKEYGKNIYIFKVDIVVIVGEKKYT